MRRGIAARRLTSIARRRDATASTLPDVRQADRNQTICGLFPRLDARLYPTTRTRMRLRVAARSSLLRFALLAALAGGAAYPSAAQQSGSAGTRVFTAEDYKRAEKFMVYNTRPLVFHDVRGKWLS